MRRQMILTMALLLAAGSSYAMTKTEATQQQRASMVLTGHIAVGADGKTLNYSLDQADRIPEPVRQMLTKTISHWRFQPELLNGQPAEVKAAMTLRVLATPLDAQRMQIQVESVSFDNDVAGAGLRYKSRPGAINYPPDAIAHGVEGTALILVEVGQQGEVLHAAATQVNLRTYGGTIDMSRWRRELGDSAVTVIKRWTFSTPSDAAVAAAGHWYALVPVDYSLQREGRPGYHPDGYGSWSAFLPGPKSVPDWYVPQPEDSIPDAVSATGLASLKPALKLLTPLDEG